MKTSELTGALLDYWVAKAAGLECGIGPASNAPDKVCAVMLETGWYFPWCPSKDWAIGGPIIERERIAIVCNRPRNRTNDGAYWDAYFNGDYTGPDGQVNCDGDISEGPTALVAAMRCYVAEKFGKEVPDA